MKKLLPYMLPLFRSIIFIICGLAVVAFTKKSFEEVGKWWSLICTFCNVITIIMLFILFKKEGKSYKNIIGEYRIRKNIRYTLLIVLVMMVLGVGGMYGFGFIIYGYVPVTMVRPIPIYLAVINTFLLPLSTIFAELPLYFGYSLNRIEENTGNKILAIAYPMFFYALQHSFIPLLLDWKHVIFRFLSFLPLMTVLGIVYYNKRKLKPLMLGHAVLDLATGLQILMTSMYPAIFEVMKSMSN